MNCMVFLSRPIPGPISVGLLKSKSRNALVESWSNDLFPIVVGRGSWMASGNYSADCAPKSAGVTRDTRPAPDRTAALAAIKGAPI